MTLFTATLLTGLLLLAAGLVVALGGKGTERALRAFPRSETAARVLVGVAGAWFLWHVYHLSEADFGRFRWFWMAGFGTLLLLAFRHAPDFLAVRGAAALGLLAALELLRAAYMQEPGQRLLLVGTVYAGIFLALWLAVSPFRMRDGLAWVYDARARATVAGFATAAWGGVLAVTAFTY